MVGIVAPSTASVGRGTPDATSVSSSSLAPAAATNTELPGSSSSPSRNTSTPSMLHTPLEELLFFQSLRSHGSNSNEPAIFARVSTALQDNEFVRAHPGYDADRLSPASLQQLYLRLLKDEVRATAAAAASAKPADPATRKRKLSAPPSPPLQSLDAAAEHVHLLPQLVDRLYARYQQHAIRVIREEEARYDALSRDIAALEQEERVAAAAAAAPAPANRTNDVAAAAASPATSTVAAANGLVKGAEGDTGLDARADGLAMTPGIAQQPTTQTIDEPTAAAMPTAAAANVPVATTAVPAEGDSLVPQLAQQNTPRKNLLAARESKSPVPRASAEPPAQTPAAKSTPPVDLSVKDAVSATKQRDASPLPGPTAPRVDAAQARPAASSANTPLGDKPPNMPDKLLGTPQAGSSAQFTPSTQPSQPFPAYATYGAAATMPTMPTPSPGHQIMQHVAAPPRSITQASQSTPVPNYGNFASPHPGFAIFQAQPSAFSMPQQALPQTPASNPSRKHNLPSINTNVSTTKWKSSGSAQKSPVPPPQSPFLPSSPELSPTERTSKTSLDSLRKLASTQEDTDTPTRTSARRGRFVAGPTGRGRPTRADSNLPKNPRPRSQSTASHVDESAADKPAVRRLRGDAATPNPATEDTSAISTPVSASVSGPRMGHRRTTTRGSIEYERAPLKRKRAFSLEGSPDVHVPSLPRQPTRPNHILATKNFHRIVQPLMQEINAHKLASMFAKPITERDAPGYSSIIYQPQDLKSIRAAISAGSRAVQAAEKEKENADMTSAEDVASPVPAYASAGAPATPGGSSLASGGIAGPMRAPASSIWLEKTADVVPPKAIVNAAQLEKEVYRMYANAVMFNLDPHRGLGAAETKPKSEREDSEEDSGSDDEGEKHYEVDDGGAFVRDAREMFASVEQSTSRWRVVEGSAVKMRGGGLGGAAVAVEESDRDEAEVDRDREGD